MSLSTSNSISLFLREPAHDVQTPAMRVRVLVHQQQHQVVFAGTCKSRLDTSNGCACPCPTATVSACFCGNKHHPVCTNTSNDCACFCPPATKPAFFCFCLFFALLEPAHTVQTPATKVHVLVHQQWYHQLCVHVFSSPPATCFCGNVHNMYRYQQLACMSLSISRKSAPVCLRASLPVDQCQLNGTLFQS